MNYSKEQFIQEFHRVAKAIEEARILYDINSLVGGNLDGSIGYGADCGIQLICERFCVPFSDYMVVTLCDFVDEDEQWDVRFEEKAAMLYDNIMKEIENGDIV